MPLYHFFVENNLHLLDYTSNFWRLFKIIIIYLTGGYWLNKFFTESNIACATFYCPASEPIVAASPLLVIKPISIKDAGILDCLKTIQFSLLTFRSFVPN